MSTEAFDLAFLQDADDGFDPAGQLKADDLIDGEYEFAIRGSTFKIIAAKNMAILQMDLEVLSAGKFSGAKMQHAIYIKDRDSADRAGKDLVKLGFDCLEWKKENGRPFSQEIQKAPKGLKGLRFFARKVTSKRDDGRVFHNLYIDRRNRTADGKPAVIGPEVLNGQDPENDDPF